MSYSDTIKRWRELTKSAALAIQNKGPESKPNTESPATRLEEPVYSLAPEDEIQPEPELPFPAFGSPKRVAEEVKPEPSVQMFDTDIRPPVSAPGMQPSIERVFDAPPSWSSGLESEKNRLRKTESRPQVPVAETPEAEIKSALGAGTMIEGKFTFDKPVRIDGHLIGEVNSSSTLVVGDGATVDATINVGSLLVYGKVSGSVLAQDKVHVMPTGTLEADVRTKRLIVNEGAVFRGGCNTR